MADKDDYLTYYREFFENFAQTVNPNDQLPVKLASYKLVNVEVVGGIIDWTTQYLTQKKCPPNLIAPLIKIVIEEIRKACKKQPMLCGFNPSDNAYEPLKLMQTVMAKTNEVCLRYLDNSMLCSLPSPGGPYFLTSIHAVKNGRRKMEDRHVVIHDLNTMFNVQEASPSSYYAVFDGHAGHDAAAYSSAHLHQFLAENKLFISNPEQALLDAFCKTDALFIDKCRVENLSSGTTAVVALLRPKEKTLYIAWVGDSQALLVNQGRLLQVVNPHKPSRRDERERIEQQGGCVLLWGTWRVNGQLAVSRAIGDAEYKPYVNAVPDIREIPLDGGEDFLILACDGLWDFVSEDSAARTVYDLVTENPDDADRISQHLVQLSREQGSTDNISVIVVFLREPSKIAAEAHWANRNCTPPVTATADMDAGLDNANNPFAIPNGGGANAATDNIMAAQKADGLLLNLTDNFKQNGTDVSPTADFFGREKSNGKRSASDDFDDDDDDFGPETDVDTVDDVLSPAATAVAKGFGDVFSNNNPAEGVYNPYMEHQEKAAMELERELQKQQSAEYEEEPRRLAREETPTPPADQVHDVSGLVDNAAESDSEDEWNYFKGDDANKENISPRPDKEVAEVPEEDDNMSQLNPNAAEFVPISPTRSIPSPACRTLLNDQVISQSPRRTTGDIDINVPNPAEFEKEVKSRPSDVDPYSNGHGDTSLNRSSTDLMETLLNGKNIDEIPEFQPGSTPSKIVPNEEFHFGPNAAPFTPAKLLDQSEAALSTKAVYGDESTATLGTSFNESEASQDTTADINLLNKESDPMSMSFYADKGDSNPFDLNQVQVLPDNIDEFLNKPDNNSLFNETISDLPEHHPLGDVKDTTEDITLNNDDAIQMTDLDKGAYYEEKELASPMEPEKELSDPDREMLGGKEECDFSKTPEPTHEDLLAKEFCCLPEKSDMPEMLPHDVELISPELRADSTSRPQSRRSEYISESKSPLPEAMEVEDLLKTEPEVLPRDVELLSPDLGAPRPDSTHEDTSQSPQPLEAKSPLPETSLIDEIVSKSPLPEVCDRPQSKTPESDIFEADSTVPELEKACGLPESKSPICELPVTESPVCQLEGAKSPVSNIEISKSPGPEFEDSPIPELDTSMPELEDPNSPICERPMVKSPVCELESTRSPVPNLEVSKSPVCELEDAKSPICELGTKSPVCDSEGVKSPICEIGTKSPVCELEDAKSPICELGTKSPVCDLEGVKSPICELVTKSPICELEDAKSPICELGTKSPVCDLEGVKSPICELGTKSPVCELEYAKSPICDLEGTKSPVHELKGATSPLPEFEGDKSPICELGGTKSPVCELGASKSPELSESKSPTPQVDDICSRPDIASPAASPAPLQVDFTKLEEIEKAEERFEEICKSPEIKMSAAVEFTSPEVIQEAQNKFDEMFRPREAASPLESPQEDITSSLKEDIASLAKSPLPDEIIDDSFVGEEPKETTMITGLGQEVAGVIQGTVVECSLRPESSPSPKLIEHLEPVEMMEDAKIFEASAPLSPIEPEMSKAEQPTTDEQPTEQAMAPQTLDLDHPQMKCVFPVPTEGEQIEIKTENISPEFAEQAIVTPSEESKQDDIPAILVVGEPKKEPVVEAEKAEEQENSDATVGAAAAAGVAAATVGAVAAVAAKEEAKAEKEEKKKVTPSPAKKAGAPKAAAPKTTTKSTLSAATNRTTSSRLNASSKTSPVKTSTAKPATTTSAPKPPATKPSPRPKPIASTPKSTEKKPLTNGDIKSTTTRSTLTARRSTTETATTKSAMLKPPTSATARLSPVKPPAAKSAATRPSTAPTQRTTTTRTTASTVGAPKPRPMNLTSKVTTSTTTGSTTKPTTLTKSPLAKTSPRPTTAAPRPKPPTTTMVSKPRVPLTKTVAKAADTEKQNKESANKLTASRSVTSTTRTASATARTTSTTVRRVESKVAATRTSKTTTTTMKSTTAKKPAELVRHTASKTKTTKVEKPKENGVSTVVTEEITAVVNTTNTVIDGESQLVKDNSPIDNKLIIETSTLVETNTAD